MNHKLQTMNDHVKNTMPRLIKQSEHTKKYCKTETNAKNLHEEVLATAASVEVETPASSSAEKGFLNF